MIHSLYDCCMIYCYENNDSSTFEKMTTTLSRPQCVFDTGG